MAREINLVPDIKNDMIKALKLRNFIFFVCIIVASASIVVALVFLSIAGGQQAIVDAKKQTLTNLSGKINGYEDLSDYLTIKDQLGNVSTLAGNKKLLSRTFGILTALLPTGADTITLSELNINLSEAEPTISFDAQANAGSEPYIDYNVLDSFKKSMQYMRYDYGNYVDRYGATIPAYCIVENNIEDGSTFYDYSRQSYYAYWLISGEGCNPSAEQEAEDYLEDEDYLEGEELTSTSSSSTVAADGTISGYTITSYNGQNAVQIWRTPQFDEWYKDEEDTTENEDEADLSVDNPSMSLDGSITGVPHFESSCITYSGDLDDSGKPRWSSTNEECLLVPEAADGISITDSSNGRGAEDELVLRFSASITLAPEVYNFTNHHMLTIAPSGRHNVTDSYVQVQSMFAERASDCSPSDTACNNANFASPDDADSTNEGGL